MRSREDMRARPSPGPLADRLSRQAAEATALAVVATLVDNGQLDYAALWQQVATLVSSMMGTGSV